MSAGSLMLKTLYEQRDSEDGQTDFEIRCGTDVHRVHKLIISAASTHFNKACSSPFKEACDGVISLDADDPQAVCTMIKFMYTLDYLDGLDHEEGCFQKETQEWLDCCRLYLHARTYVLAGKYCLDELKIFAGRNFMRVVFYHKPSYATIRSAAAIVYEVTPEDDSLRKHIARLVAEESSSWPIEHLDNLMLAIPGSAKNIAIELFKTVEKKDEEIRFSNNAVEQLSQQVTDLKKRKRSRL